MYCVVFLTDYNDTSSKVFAVYCVVFLTDFNDTSSIVVCCSAEKKNVFVIYFVRSPRV